MLLCPIDLQNASATDFECSPCNSCSPSSALNYPFERDLLESGDFVNAIQKFIESNTFLRCLPPEQYKYPDIRVMDVAMNGFLLCRIEAKFLEGKAFVKASEIVGLAPKETLVVDEPKLLAYFQRKVDDRETYKREVPTFVFWKFDRPCSDIGGITVFQEVNVLHDIYKEQGAKRFFERETASSDIVCGAKKGVTRKYHFSIRETRPIWEFLPDLFALAAQHGVAKTKPPATFQSHNLNAKGAEPFPNAAQATERPTDKQVRYAHFLAKERGVAIPKECLASKIEMMAFITMIKGV